MIDEASFSYHFSLIISHLLGDGFAIDNSSDHHYGGDSLRRDHLRPQIQIVLKKERLRPRLRLRIRVLPPPCFSLCAIGRNERLWSEAEGDRLSASLSLWLS